ncbi:MAG: hypothetical protein V1721_09000 [Pseudomonadota bacterium]
MRKSTLLWLTLAAFCGTALFHTSQRVHDLREETAALETSIGKEEESIRVLQAEWSALNRPDRLERLAKTWLKLAPLNVRQFVRMEDIPLRVQNPETGSRKPEKEGSPGHLKIANSREFGDVMKSLEVE